MYGVLICEDESEILQMVSDYLKYEGYRVFTASSGIESYDIFCENADQIDCVLLDIMMPNLNGYEVLRLIRQDSNVPIIMITALSSEGDKEKGFELGADDYIIKPFSFSEVSLRVKAQIRRNTQYAIKQEHAQLIQNGQLSLDLYRMEAAKNGKLLNLYTKEFYLFKLFMENIGHTFTQKMLYETIWQEDYQGDANTIMVHIFKLREKIEDNPKKPKYIKTIRGVGYRMEHVHDK